MISKLEKRFRRARLSISRNQWLVRILGLSEAREAPPGERPRGLIILQIDGLAKRQLEAALDNNSMPFLKKLITRESYQLHSLYSGQPSSTPAVQGEFFYGVKGCVPAFSFKRHDDNRTVVMVEPNAAATVEAQLAEQGGQPLLLDGSVFSNIFTGGAKESSFCASSFGWSSIMPSNNPLKMMVYGLLNILSFARVILLMVVEFGLAVVDFFRGLINGRDFFQELKYVPTRVAACVLMRELVTIGVSLDAVRGMPIIHANFIGYDEQAHRRGPSSKFAHWSLSGIDGAIRRIWNTAKRSRYRDYDIWVHSDHGQESVVPYPKVLPQTIQTAMQTIFTGQLANKTAASNNFDSPHQLNKTWSRRANWLGIPHFGKRLAEADDRTLRFTSLELPEVVAMGPIGFVYLPQKMSFAEKSDMAKAMVSERQVPMALLLNDDKSSPAKVFAWTAEGQFELPRDTAKVLGESHPFLQDIDEDFIQLVSHPDAGDFVLCGWHPENPPISFRMENGSHAGPGVNETHAFALMPGDTPLPITNKNYLRFLSLREAALKLLGRQESSALDTGSATGPQVDEHKQLTILPSGKAPEHQHCLRVLTYNIHSCIGMDGMVSTARIARVIAHYQPDVVALQELDVDRAKTDHIDQAEMIADELSMDIHFHPVKHLERGRFGNAILTDLPMRKVKADQLSVPDPNRKGLSKRLPFNEPRGAVWTEIDFHGQAVNMITTHLGLTPRERREQVDTLLSDEWLNSPDCQGPTILCGDFNATPRQAAIKRLSGRLKNAQIELYGKAAKKTFAGRYPTICIDHVMVDSSTKIKEVIVANHSLAKVASDHLPLIVDLELAKN